MDRVSKERRSWNMSRIRSKDTKPEVAVRSLLHRQGFRFRLHRRDLPGTPDIVLPKYKTVIFVHGCFWHRHPRCRYAYIPKTRSGFWEEKFAENVKRDRLMRSQLARKGWRVVVIWECQTGNARGLIDSLRRGAYRSGRGMRKRACSVGGYATGSASRCRRWAKLVKLLGKFRHNSFRRHPVKVPS